MHDIYTPYELGLRALLARLDRAQPAYRTALVYQQRLAENLAAARTYGDTREREASRAEILARLSDLAQSALGVSFAELCPAPDVSPGTGTSPGSGATYHIDTGGGTVVMGDVHTGGDFVGRDRNGPDGCGDG